MRKTGAFIIKFIMLTVALWLVLGLVYGVSFGNILTTSIILTIVSFLIDMYVLPRVGNVVAAVGDFAIAYFGIWLIGGYMLYEPFTVRSVTTAAFLSAVLILVGELFYHRYLRNYVFDNVDAGGEHYRLKDDQLQVEVSEEFDPDRKNTKKND